MTDPNFTIDLYASRRTLQALEADAPDDQWGRFVDERLGIEAEILELPITAMTTMADVAAKVEIIKKQIDLFDDVSLLDQLHAQLLAAS
jgi:hypothetical protein